MKKQTTQVAEISVSYRPAIANKPINELPRSQAAEVSKQR
jgi:hypothetical protein